MAFTEYSGTGFTSDLSHSRSAYERHKKKKKKTVEKAGGNSITFQIRHEVNKYIGGISW